MRSISRPALAKPTRSLRWSIDVDPNWVVTTSSAAWHSRSRSSPISSSISFFCCVPHGDVVAVGGLPAGPCSAATTALDLVLGDERALHPDRLARAHRQEQPVALADQLLGARLVEDDPAVGERRGGEGEPRRHVRLDQPGDDVDAGPLGGEHQVDAGRARELGDAHDGVLDVARRDHHQVGELVDDHQQVRVRLQLPLAALAAA